MLSINDIEINLVCALEDVWGFLPEYDRINWFDNPLHYGVMWVIFFGEDPEDSFKMEVRQYNDSIGTIDFRIVDGEIWKWDLRTDIAIWAYDTADFSNILRKLKITHLLLKELK